MRPWNLLQRRMAAKVFLAIALGIGSALVVQAVVESRDHAQTLEQETGKWAVNIANLFVGAVETSMLQGDGIKVKQSIRDLKERISHDAEVRIYDQRGIEVFGEKPPPPNPETLRGDIQAVLQKPVRRMRGASQVLVPVKNEKECHSCHPKDKELRGILDIDIDAEATVRARDEVFVDLLTEGFTHVMTADREDKLDDYFSEVVSSATTVKAIALYNRERKAAYGRLIAGIEPDVLDPLFAVGAKARFEERDGNKLALVPLPMGDRCGSCHDDEVGTIRGVLAISLAPVSAPEDATRDLERIIVTSLRYIMLSRLGRRIADFLDEVAETGAVRTIVIFDNVGRRYWTTDHPAPQGPVAAVLASGKPVVTVNGTGKGGRVTITSPLENGKKCERCHGTADELRGAVSVSVSTSSAADARAATMYRYTWFTAANLIGILIMLAGLLHYLVARPVRRIGDVAEEVGKGNLAVTVDRADPRGDEIARLGQRINEMVRGLRTKMNLEKFVSEGAARAAEGAGLREIQRTGERRRVTVLFSDIRGFTSYSETVAPEVVVDMLNRLLAAQADVVRSFGGDIDKFVGDELMAVFTGEYAEMRAILCAARMIQAVEMSRSHGEAVAIGIGISAGDVVYGAIGHEKRMDFTVIGDVVNTGARLCSAAAPGQVLVTGAVRHAASGVREVDFVPTAPLAVKGKREPLEVFAVVGRQRQ